MIIDSKQYNGMCSCGREHKMETLFCIVESGCLNKIDKYLSEYQLTGYSVAVYDDNTYKATEDRHPAVDLEVVLPCDNLHANEHGVELLMQELPENVNLLIAIGSGTIHDITRYCAYQKKIDFVSCPTAASVDGFCSSVAAMTWHGCKKTLTAVAPKIVVADLDIIKKAPVRLAKSGFGDMVGKYIALTDWKIGNIIKGEYLCDRISKLTLQATNASISAIDGIIAGDEKAYETLMYGLLLSGLAMQMIGNSRPASGAEHHISHIIEMEPHGLQVHSNALHGEKVGVGTLLVIKAYQQLLLSNSVSFSDYSTYTDDEIEFVFGKQMSVEIIKENESDSAFGILAENLKVCFNQIKEQISSLYKYEDLRDMYIKYGIKSSLSDIEVSDDKIFDLLKYAPMVRNRLTLLRLLSSGSIKL